ncbi:MAG: UDP-N-acetylglucosamine 2-epimerase (non-hydrolyzing) [Chloroflexi bacterium]|nr:UDP-N-acetylglucosamine 2-epimerase (non-hydrolyzing) [Chloroflexota bacterium]
MKVATIVGARPQFIKASTVSRVLREKYTEILIHTGQHYDDNMSAVFFQELGIHEPEYNLGVGSGNHGAQTGVMLAGIENILLDERPDWVMVYGDTNSTLAGALAAAKLHIHVAHVEAGLRSFNRAMPEEINRILTDHISNLLFCPTQTAVDNLHREGIVEGVHLVGDVMYNSLHWAIEQNRVRPDILNRLGLEEKKYLLVTVHRAENVDKRERLGQILDAFNRIEEPLVFPVHPRTRKKINEVGYLPNANVQLIAPTGYLDMVRLESAARVILTDSGGVQKEAYWLGIPCITLRNETEWIETIESGWNVLSGVDSKQILQILNSLNNKTTNDIHPDYISPVDRFIELMAKS